MHKEEIKRLKRITIIKAKKAHNNRHKRSKNRVMFDFVGSLKSAFGSRKKKRN